VKKKEPTIIIVGILFVAILFVIGGCGKSTSPVGPQLTGDDETNLRVLIEDNPELFSYDIEDGSEESQGVNQDIGNAKTIEPVAFWREITSREREVDIHITHPGGDSLPCAEVTITTYYRGLFHTVSMDSEYTKEIDDTAVRYAYLEKESHDGSDAQMRAYGGWRLKKVSGWEVASDPCTKEIYSLQITSGSVDTTIADMSSLWDLEDLLAFDPGDSVTLTVDTGNPEDLVFLHAPLCVRRSFKHIGGGIFTGTWVTTEDPHVAARSRPRHAAIDVIDHGTVFDDELPYDSRVWGMVYFVGENPHGE